MMPFDVLADMRFFPDSGLGKVEKAILQRKPENVTVTNINVPGKYGHPLSFFRLSQSLLKHSPGRKVFWSAGFVPPLYSRIPAVVTVHDLTHLHFYGQAKREYFNYVFRPLFRRCAAIICVSEHTKNELIEWGNIPESKVHVVHNGMEPTYINNQRVADLGYQYILYPGNHKNYKNVINLIKAYQKSRLIEDGVHLVLTGTKEAYISAVLDGTDIDDHVHFLGHVPEDDMPALYKGARVVCYISRYEGFGLPILEAMASHVPVITSNVTSMPEVAGDAAIVLDPLSIDEIAKAMRQLTFDLATRSALIDKGLERIKLFNWDRSARQVWDILEHCAQS